MEKEWDLPDSRLIAVFLKLQKLRNKGAKWLALALLTHEVEPGHPGRLSLLKPQALIQPVGYLFFRV